jgi:hypothetical protein
MKATFLSLVFGLVVVACLVPGIARADEEEDRAIEAIRKSGGYVALQNPPRGVRFLVKTDVDAVMRELKHLKHLNMVIFQPGTPVTDEQLKGLAVVKGLTFLDVSSPHVTDKGLETVARHQGLEVLKISCKNTTYTGLKALAGLPKLRLLMYGFQGTRAGFHDARGFPRLEQLFTSGMLTAEDLRGIGRITTLKELRLSRSTISDAGVNELTGLKQLQILDLSQTDLTDRGVQGLEGMTDLEILKLSKTKITDAGLKSLGKLKNLRTLGLSQNQIGDAGLKALRGLEKLTSLDLSATQLTDDGLMQLGQLPALNSVRVTGTKVTTAGRTKFIQTFQKFVE